MKSAREVRYAVANDSTVERLRELAYQDGIRDAAKLCDEHAAMRVYNTDEKTVARACAARIRKLERTYGDDRRSSFPGETA